MRPGYLYFTIFMWLVSTGGRGMFRVCRNTAPILILMDSVVILTQLKVPTEYEYTIFMTKNRKTQIKYIHINL